MKILNGKQTNEVDQETLKKQGISSWQLMERASLAAFSAIQKILSKRSVDTVHLFCGTGNNGGDGLAIAYHLFTKGYCVKVYKVCFSSSTSQDFALNEKRLREEAAITLHTLRVQEDISLCIQEKDVVVDAIFGVGLNKSLPDFVRHLIAQLNSSKAYKIAIDVPSGMYVHQATPAHAEVFRADVCLTFELPKLPFLLPETGVFLDHFIVLSIGLDAVAIQSQATPYLYMDWAFVKNIYQPRKRFSHKGTFGSVLLVGGQEGMIGSILLAAKAAMRSGAGKAHVMLPAQAHANLHHYVPEALAIPHASPHNISFTQVDSSFQLGIGMGIGTHEEVVSIFKKYLKQATRAILVDADGLTILSLYPDLLAYMPSHSIITPHPGELKRLIGEWENDFDKLKKIQTFARKHHLIVVAKDAYTCICDGDSFYFNTTGNAGMATAGSGDVLSGVITSLLAQQYPPLEAAQLGVFVHGLAGDIALSKESKESLVASDLLKNLGKAFSKLQKKHA